MQPSHQGFRRLPLKFWTAIHVFQMLPEADILSRLFHQESFSKLSRSNQRPTKKSKPYAVLWAKSKDISMVWNDWNGAQVLSPLLRGANCCAFPGHVHCPTPQHQFVPLKIPSTEVKSTINPNHSFWLVFTLGYTNLYPLVFRRSISWWWPLTPPPLGGGLETTMGHPALRWRFGCLCHNEVHWRTLYPQRKIQKYMMIHWYFPQRKLYYATQFCSEKWWW